MKSGYKSQWQFIGPPSALTHTHLPSSVLLGVYCNVYLLGCNNYIILTCFHHILHTQQVHCPCFDKYIHFFIVKLAHPRPHTSTLSLSRSHTCTHTHTHTHTLTHTGPQKLDSYTKAYGFPVCMCVCVCFI